MKLDTLEQTKRLYPHWLDKSKDSNFSKHLSIVASQQKDLMHKLKTVEWGGYIEKPLQIWKTQTEPYKYSMNFKSLIPSMKEINIYKNPILSNKNEVISYGELIYSDTYADDMMNHFEYTHNDETELYLKGYDNISKMYGLSWNQATIHERPFNFGAYGEYDSYTCGVVTTNEDDVTLSTELVNEYEEDDDVSQTYGLCVVPCPNCLIGANDVVEFKTPSYSRGVSIRFLYGKSIVTNYNIIANGGEKFKFEMDDEQNLWVSIDDGDRENIIEDVWKSYFDEGGDVKLSMQIYSFHRFSTSITLHDFRVLKRNVKKDRQRIIPNDTYLLEVYTHDDYHFLKGFPENDYTSKEDNILQYKYNETFLDISLEKISYSDFLTFRVHKDNIRQIFIRKNDKIIYKQDFVIDYNDTGVVNRDFSYTYFDEDSTNAPTYGDGYFTKHYEIEDEMANYGKIYYVKDDTNEYVFRLPLGAIDFDDDGYLKDTYDLEVITYEKRYKCKQTHDKIYSKRYNGYDGFRGDCFDHDYSLDILGTLLNVPRFRFYQVYRKNNYYYSRTYPSYNNRATEDDYHYMKRIQYYISNYNHIVFPVLEFWKYYYADCTLASRRRIIGKQDSTYLLTNNDDCFDTELVIDEETGIESVVEYSINKATNIQGESNNVFVGDSSWFEAIIVDNLFIVPFATYRLRYGVMENYENVSLRMICYNREMREIRTTSIILDEFNDDDERYNSSEGYEYVDTNINIPSDAVIIRLVLESDDYFEFKDVTFERVTVRDVQQAYMGTREDYNSNVYDLYVDYDDIPTNIRFGGTERFNMLLNRSLPLTKKGFLSVELNEESTSTLVFDTDTHLRLLNYFDEGEVFSNVTTIEKTITHFIRGGSELHLSFSSKRDEHNALSDDYLLTTTLTFYDENDNMVGEYEFEDNIDSDVWATVSYSHVCPSNTAKATLNISSTIAFDLQKLRLSIDGEISEFLVSDS